MKRRSPECRVSSLRRRGHRAGIDDVVAEIRAVVDTGYDNVGTLIEKPHDRKHHTISRGPVDRTRGIVDTRDTEGAIEGQGVTRGALLTVRRDNSDIPPRFGGCPQRLEARSEKAIVVCQKHSCRHNRNSP